MTSRIDIVERIVDEALALPEASLVIFRRGVLVEFKTGLLSPRLVSSIEAGHRSWQTGAFDGHHCHLDLTSVRSVLFDAEPVSCQGGRINYTVWFRSEGDCGNPYRTDGLFSVTLNSPYEADGSPRAAVIGPMLSLYRRHRSSEYVDATPGFFDASGDAPMTRTPQPSSEMRTK